MAVANYHEAHGCFPPAFVADAGGKPMHSWRVLILPFLDGQQLYDQYDFREPWDGPNNSRLLLRRPSSYGLHAPETESSRFTNYVAVVGPDTVWPGSTCRSNSDLKDGTSNTLLIVENVGAEIPWSAPRDLDFATMSFKTDGTPADGISSIYTPAAVVTADGNVRVLSPETTRDQLRGLLTIAGGEATDESAIPWVHDARYRARR